MRVIPAAGPSILRPTSGYAGRLPRTRRRAADRCSGTRMTVPSALLGVVAAERRSMRDAMECTVAFVQEQNTELGLADARGVFQHRFEHRLKLARRAELMTLSTSEVAVCCSSDSDRSSVRCRSSLSSRAFSIAITAWAAKVLDQLDLLLGKGPHLLRERR